MEDKFSIQNSTILLTGGTGSFGKALIGSLLSNPKFKGIIRIYSRDEFKQYQIQQLYPDDPRLRFFIGDVRDKDRLVRAMAGADIAIHAAALKQVTVAEYNPFEVVKTNILGSQNVVDAALDAKISKAILISSDKAVHPINLYGATKMVAEKIFIQGNIYSGKQKTIFSVCRYGNVLGSRGSVVPLFLKQMKKGTLTITHKDMTRFWITLPQATEFVEDCLASMHGGEIFIPKLPSVRIYELAKAISPNATITYSGIRAGEKIHEELIAEEESLYSKELKEHYIILPPKPYWSKIQFKDYQATSQKPFCYRSDNNSIWLSQQQIKTAVSGMELQSN
jgi:UDP-N-acetylglucosamine 4,6-dehydratase